MANPKEIVSSVQPRRRRRQTRDDIIKEAFDRYGDSVIVQLMKASGRYDSLYRLYKQPVMKKPDTCVSNRSGVC
jgi:hypothetical protein